MNGDRPQQTAKIYEFPRKFAAGARRQLDRNPAVDPRFVPAIGVDFGSGWYHEEAIREADRLPRH